MKSLIAFVLFSAAWTLSSVHVHSQERPDWVTWSESPNRGSRDGEDVSTIVMHYTAGGSQDSSVSWFRNEKAQASAHYVIGRDGKIVQMVELDQAAWHAGKSELMGRPSVNKFSVGIEICNWGKLRKEGDEFLTYTNAKYTGPTPFKDAKGEYWEPFTDEQYDSAAKICLHCMEKFRIRHITGHSDIAIPAGRKIDPGSAFDWDKVKAALKGKYDGQIGPINR